MLACAGSKPVQLLMAGHCWKKGKSPHLRSVALPKKVLSTAQQKGGSLVTSLGGHLRLLKKGEFVTRLSKMLGITCDF